MAFSKEFEMNIEEVIECISEGNSSWGTFLAKIAFGNSPAKLNLRKMNIDQGRCSSGIALTDEEWNSAVNALIRMGYGDIDVVKEELDKRNARLSTEGAFFDES